MRSGWIAVAVIALGLCACEKANPLEAQCSDTSLAPDRRVAACTTMIETGNLAEPARAIALANRGDAHLSATQITPALRDFEASLALDEKNVLATRGRASILLDSGQLDAAEPLVDRLISNEVELGQAHLMKGRIAYARGDYAAAVAQFDQALAKDAQLAQALAMRGRAKERLGNDTGARADYDAAIAITPPRADALAWRCWSRLAHIKDAGAAQQSETTQARADAEASVTANPRFVEGETCLGILRLRAGEWGDAKSAFDAALHVQPGNPIALFGRGIARRRAGDGEGSQDMYQATGFSAHVRELYLSLGVETY